jgi:hypothetical protein
VNLPFGVCHNNSSPERMTAKTITNTAPTEKI